MSPSRQRVVIDHLVLEGFDLTPEQAEAFRHRLASELETQLADATWSPELSARQIESIAVDAIELTGSPDALDLATDVAARLADSLKNAG